MTSFGRVDHRSRSYRRPDSVVVYALALLLPLMTATAGASATTSTRDSAALSAVDGAETEAVEQRPNIVVIMTDDQNLDEMRWMPKSRRLLGGRGITFSSALSPAPLCCPAWAGFLTGQYGHNNGVQHNAGPFGGFSSLDGKANTVGSWLQAAGYSTALVGKFLNGYTGKHPAQPGWTRWNPAVAHVYDYVGTGLKIGPTVRTFDANITTVVERLTRQHVRDFAKSEEPFFIWSSHVAPHGRFGGFTRAGGIVWRPPRPTPSHADVLDDVVLPASRKPSFNKPGPRPWPYPGTMSTGRSASRMQAEFTGRIQSLQDVDDMVQDVVSVLRETGELDETYIFLVSDNGHLFGEHRLVGKNVLYREALEIPLLVRVPGATNGRTVRSPVTLVDLTATIVDLASTTASRPLDGRSFAPLLAGRRMAWRDTQLVQAGSSRARGPSPGWAFRGVRTERYTYMRRVLDGQEFLYDRARTPRETRSVAQQQAYRPVLLELRKRYRALADCQGSRCDVSFGPVPRPRATG